MIRSELVAALLRDHPDLAPPEVAGVFLAGGFMSDIGNNAFIALCLGLTAAVTLGWLGVVGYGVWHFLFG